MKRTVLIILIALLSQSCATMFSGTSYTANISATKPNSEIYIDGRLKGTDNVSLRYDRKKEMEIEVKNGQEVEGFTVVKTVKWGSQAANLLNWVYLPVGTIIDLATGGIYQPEHKKVEEVYKVDEKTFNIIIDNAGL